MQSVDRYSQFSRMHEFPYDLEDINPSFYLIADYRQNYSAEQLQIYQFTNQTTSNIIYDYYLHQFNMIKYKIMIQVRGLMIKVRSLIPFIIISLQVFRWVESACPHGGETGPNIAPNGGFESDFSGWSITPGGYQVGSGSSYNSRWPAGTHVIELDYHVNEIYSQTHTCQQGVYLLRFQYAAREGYSLETNSMKIYWNDEVVWDMMPSDYNIYTKDIYVDANEGQNKFGIGGAGAGDGVGMTVDNVEFYKTIYWHYKVVDGSCVCITGYYAPVVNAQCQLCTNAYAHCLECTVGACSQCNNSANHFLDTFNNPGNCEACSLSGCSTCSSLYTCETCNNAAGYFINSFSTCSLCTLSHCTTCSSLYACQTCDIGSGYYLNQTSKFCQQCSITGCLSCVSLTQCATCNTSAKYYLHPTSNLCAYCNPNSNKFINATGGCQACSLTGCLTCSSLTTCSLCNSYQDYKLNPNTNLCQLCPLQNCIICSSLTTCNTCDQQNFYGIDAIDGNQCVPCNQSCTCSGFSLPYIAAQNRCTSVCGDGYVAEPYQQCDDENTDINDGCSQTCKIEAGFVCEKQNTEAQFTNTTNPTVCVLNGFKVQLKDWYENKPFFCDDKIIFELSFTPYDDQGMTTLYTSLDYEDIVSINNSALELEKAQYNSDKGITKLTYRYSQSLHGKQLSLIFNASLIPQLAIYGETIEKFRIEDTAGPVITHSQGQCYNLDGAFGKIGAIGGGISLGILLVCVFLKKKLIGLELLGVLQVAYFSLANYNFLPLMLQPLISMKSLATGLNVEMSKSMGYPEQYLQGNSLISYKVQAMGYTSETTVNFFANVNVMILITLSIPVFALILKASSFAFEILNAASLYTIKQVFLTFMIYCSMGFGFMSGLHLNYERKYYEQYNLENQFNRNIKTNYFFGNLMTMAAMTLVFTACVLLQMGQSEGFGQYRSAFKKDGRGPKSYLTVLVIVRFILGIMMAALSSSDTASIATLVIATSFLLFIIAVLPFREKIQNARSLAVQSCIVAILLIQVTINGLKNDIQELAKSKTAGIIVWTIIGGILIFSIICVALVIKQKWDKYKRKEKLKDYVYDNKVPGNNSMQVLPEQSIQGFN